jgi:biopolymer transport protein ExbD
VISIANDRTVYVEDQAYNMNELEPVLQRLLEPHGETPTIRLNADRALVMEEVFSVLNIAKKNRYRVILGTRPVS